MTGHDSIPDGSIKLQADSLRDQALRVIRARIISGAMRPGQLYALGATASDLGVSVTPVREAVLELAREHLVELARNRGFRVREMSEHELNEIEPVGPDVRQNPRRTTNSRVHPPIPVGVPR